jgi:hypothetical protein
VLIDRGMNRQRGHDRRRRDQHRHAMPFDRHRQSIKLEPRQGDHGGAAGQRREHPDDEAHDVGVGPDHHYVVVRREGSATEDLRDAGGQVRVREDDRLR